MSWHYYNHVPEPPDPPEPDFIDHQTVIIEGLLYEIVVTVWNGEMTLDIEPLEYTCWDGKFNEEIF